MKTADIEKHLTNRGYERGTLYVLQAQQEQLNTMQRSVNEMAQMMNMMCAIMDQLATGTVGMKQEMEKRMAKAGLSGVSVDAEELGHNTRAIGE